MPMMILMFFASVLPFRFPLADFRLQHVDDPLCKGAKFVEGALLFGSRLACEFIYEA